MELASRETSPIHYCILHSVDGFHNGDRLQNSFVLMLISLSNLAIMGKIQKNICNKVKRVGLINIDTKGITNTPPFMKVVD